MFSGFHSSSYDPDPCTLGSRRNKRSPWVPWPIEVDGGSWRTGAQENTAARAHGHGRRFIKKGMCRMRRGYASRRCWHKCSKCKAPVHTHITCSKVHSDPCDERSHICDSCFVGSKEQPGSPTSASSPGKVAAAGVLLSLAAAASGEDAARKSAAASKTSDVGIRTSLIASQGTSGTASSCSRPVIISQPGQTREHARHTPRTESGMCKPPPRVGRSGTQGRPSTCKDLVLVHADGLGQG